MSKADTVLQIASLAAIAALGIPVALSVKYRDGTLTAKELRSAFGVLVWKIDVHSPLEFAKVRIRLEVSEAGAEEILAALEVPFKEGGKFADVGIFVDGSEAILRCAEMQTNFQLPPPVQSMIRNPINPGGKGKESGAGIFKLAEEGNRTLRAVIETE